MADLPQQYTLIQYLAGGSQDSFAVPFFVPLADDGAPDLDVYVTPSGQDANPNADIQTWSVNYIYTPNEDPISGGTVQFLTDYIPASGDVVTIVRDVAASLNVDFSDAQNFSGANLDDALERLLLIEQQNKTYALQRNLSYVVNSYIPQPNLIAMTQIPVLGANQIWKGSGAGTAVIAVDLEENPDVSTLRSELANENEGTDGARIVGYYDTITNEPTTVDAMLTSINNEIVNINEEISNITESGLTFIGKQILTGSGTYTPTTGTKFIWVRGVGGGGGGHSVSSTSSHIGVATGGSAGAYGEAWRAVSGTIPYSCGAGGAADSNGGSTTFGTAGSILNLGGGLQGNAANNQSSTSGVSSGVVGGTLTTADIGCNGASSNYGIWTALTVGVSGAGANSKFGAGGLGKVSTANGDPASGYGAGGAGAMTIGAGSQTGGVGSPGVLIVFEYGEDF
jgi:hypothetical protein